MAKFVAIKAAYYDGRRVRVGDEVSAPEGFKATWAVPKASAPKAEAPAKETPVALSQLDQGKSFVEVHKGKATKTTPPKAEDLA